MKNKLIIVGILMALVLGLCAYEMVAIDKVAAESNEILASLNNKKHSKAKLSELSEQLYDLWKNNMFMMAIFVQHDQIEEVEACLAIIKKAITQGDNATFQTEITRAEILIQGLRDSEFPHIENIL
jgi:hypothetical protein